MPGLNKCLLLFLLFCLANISDSIPCNRTSDLFGYMHMCTYIVAICIHLQIYTHIHTEKERQKLLNSNPLTGFREFEPSECLHPCTYVSSLLLMSGPKTYSNHSYSFTPYLQHLAPTFAPVSTVHLSPYPESHTPSGFLL